MPWWIISAELAAKLTAWVDGTWGAEGVYLAKTEWDKGSTPILFQYEVDAATSDYINDTLDERYNVEKSPPGARNTVISFINDNFIK